MLKIDHVVFPIWDAQKSLAFYRDIMGFRLSNALSGPDWGGYPWLMLFFAPGDGREIVLVALKGVKKPKPDGIARDARHLAFAERSVRALAKWRTKLARANIDFWEEAHGTQKSLYFEDPNGIVLEVTAPPSRPAKQAGRKARAMAEQWIAA